MKIMHLKNKLICFVFLAAVCAFSCTNDNGGQSATSGKDADSKATTPSPKTLSESERELKSMKTADFDYIFTFKRKDGEAFDSEDKRFLKQKTYKANRRTLTKDEKLVFIGSNYKIDDKDLAALKKRFDFEDFSKTEEERKMEQNSNSNSSNTANKNVSR